jgi:hypothetical protein
MNKKEINDLMTLIEHCRRDISYKTSGTYLHIDDNGSLTKLDTKAIRASERAINVIKRIILNGK